MKNQIALRALLAILFTGIFLRHASAQLYWAGAGLNPATAGSGTWNYVNMQWSSTFPGYTAAVWDSNIANFNGTGGGTVTVISGVDIIVNDINFGAHAGAFTLDTTGFGLGLDVRGTGITNNSANTQTIDNSGFTSFTEFRNSATAANATIINSGNSSNTDFLNSATAGNATITSSGLSGNTDFENSATAANATITNSGISSFTQFSNSATAANASITNSGNSSEALFQDSATAANATITNSGTGSETIFQNSATAANAIITNSGSSSLTEFFNSASGGNATLINANSTASIDISQLTTTGTTAGSIAGNGFLDLGSKNLAVGSNNTSTTFSGVIQDGGLGGGTGGSLTKVGTGTLILSGNSTYTGETDIDAGTLQLDGTIHSDTFLDNDAATLTGDGTISGHNLVLQFGVVSPGHGGIGTLTVTGGVYDQFNDTTLQIGVAGTGANEHGLIVANSATVSGTLQVLRLNNFNPGYGSTVQIISDVPGGHFGMFTHVSSTFPGLLQPVPKYDDPSEVYIEFLFTDTFLSQALTRNQRAVAADIDAVVTDQREGNLIAFLGSEVPANLPHDYDLIAPEELASIYEMGFSQAVVTNMNLTHRMDDIHAGSTGYSGPVVEIPTGKDEAPISDKNVVTKNVAPAFVPCPENRWGIFAVGSGDFVNVGNDDDNAHGYALDNGSMLVGVDYRFGNHVAIGIDGEYVNNIAELVDNGRVYADGGKAGAFATVYGFHFLGSNLWLDLAGNGGWNSYDIKRIGLQDEVVRGSTDGTEWNGMLAYGGDWNFGQLTVGTWSTLQYTDVQFNSFTDHGSLAPLEYPDQDEDSFRSTSGVRASYTMKYGACGFIRPEVRVAWQHEYGDEAYPIDSRLASGAGDLFRVWGPTVGRDAALIDAGVTWQFNARLAASAFYDGVIGRDNYASHAVSGGVRIGF